MSWHHGLLRSKPILCALTLAAICLTAYILLRVPTVSVDHQEKLQTQTSATDLMRAIEDYYLDHRRLPEAAKDEEQQTEGEEGRNLLRILLALDAQGKNLPSNKWIRYLCVEETTSKQMGGLLYQDRGTNQIPQGLYDAWGRPFHVKFDTDNDQQIQDPLARGDVVRNKVVIVYSYGKDGKPGGGDDIKTW
jgi:hypothetical protein